MLKEKSAQVFNYVRENGGKVSVEELKTALGRTTASVNGCMLSLSKAGLLVREVEGEGDDKVTYFVITEKGKTFDPNAEDAE